MRALIQVSLVLTLIALGVWYVTFSSHKTTTADDPYLWLEDIIADKSLAWVKPHNDKTLNLLRSSPLYAKYEKRLSDVLYAKDKLATPDRITDGYVYNFWQDEKSVRGLWRRMPIAQYKKDRSAEQWDILLDLDKFASAEKKNWVFKGAKCIHDMPDQCVVFLSDGGKDASVIHEFNLKTKSFIKDGFNVPEAKQMFSWLDQDQALIGTDFGPGSMTTSGYPRVVKLWKRGEPLGNAQIIYKGDKADMSVAGYQLTHKGQKITIIEKRPTFFEVDAFLLSSAAKLEKIAIPQTASIEALADGHLIVLIKKPWEVAGQVVKAGSIVAIRVEDIADPKPTVVWEPDAASSYTSLVMSKDYLYISTQRNVAAQLHRYQNKGKTWVGEQVALPASLNIEGIIADEHSEEIFLIYDGFLDPTTVASLSTKSLKPATIAQLPKRFDASGMKVTQNFATSKDGTAIPYFQISKASIKLDGENPTLLYGYGGFEVSMNPYYLSSPSLWLENGGVFVLSNIRGGGEFGPAWHQAALKENRQKAFDDFIAIAEDLVKRKVTKAAKLGILGGSNGGLLMGAVMTQRPELFGAVSIQVPLLDMMRYHHLLAGASWMGEYGNPDDPTMRPIIAKYSPYQNLKADAAYPPTLIMTSTKDDRVHPGHARKMTARLEEFKKDVLYYENIDGGHSAAANLEERIRFWSMSYTFFSSTLGFSF